MGGRLPAAGLLEALRFAAERGGGCGGGVAGEGARFADDDLAPPAVLGAVLGAVRGEPPLVPARARRGVRAVCIGCDTSSIAAAGRTRPSPRLALRFLGGGDGGADGS